MSKLTTVEKILEPITNEIKNKVENIILYSDSHIELERVRFTYINKKDIRLLISFIVLEEGKQVYRYLPIGDIDKKNTMPTIKPYIQNINAVLSNIYLILDNYESDIYKAGLIWNDITNQINTIVSDNIKLKNNTLEFRYCTISIGYEDNTNMLTLKLRDVQNKYNMFVRIREEKDGTLSIKEHKNNSNVLNLNKMINLILLVI